MRAFVRSWVRALVAVLAVVLLVPTPTAAGSAASGLAPAARDDSARASAGAAVSVSAGGEHTCEVRADRSLWCWGRNSYGQLGQGRTGGSATEPVRVGTRADWATVATGAAFTCAVTTGRALYCWGVNHRGQIGDGTRAVATRPKRVGRQSMWTDVAAGQFHACATRTNGTLWCWGDNSAGELGLGTITDRSTPTRLPGRDWASVTTGGWHTCAVKRNGSLWCWGRNTFGQLGTANNRDQSRPVQIGTSTWRDVAASYTHTCGVRVSGEARCWGRGTTGQLGSGTADSNRPLVVPGVSGATSVAVTEGSSCVLSGVGSLRCWGANNYRQVGARGTGPRTRAGTFEQVAAGWLHVCAVTTAGATTCWGNNEWGQLGTGRAGARVGPASFTPAATTAERRRRAYDFGLATFNMLGNHHTHPYAHDDRFASSRLRAEWTYQALEELGVDVAVLPESTEGQLVALLRAGNGDLAAFPDPANSTVHIETSVAWDPDVFEAVQTRILRTQFTRRALARPLVKLRHRATGRAIWVLGVHNAGWDNQRQREQATEVQVATVRELEKGTAPVFYLGDMNEKQRILCKVLRRTGLDSPMGGRLVGNRCVPPRRHMKVDWLFGSERVSWSGFDNSRHPLVRLSTDHSVPVVRVGVPG